MSWLPIYIVVRNKRRRGRLFVETITSREGFSGPFFQSFFTRLVCARARVFDSCKLLASHFDGTLFMSERSECMFVCWEYLFILVMQSAHLHKLSRKRTLDFSPIGNSNSNSQSIWLQACRRVLKSFFALLGAAHDRLTFAHANLSNVKGATWPSVRLAGPHKTAPQTKLPPTTIERNTTIAEKRPSCGAARWQMAAATTAAIGVSFGLRVY